MPDYYIVHHNLSTIRGNDTQSWFIIYRSSDDLEICRFIEEGFATTICAALNNQEIKL